MVVYTEFDSDLKEKVFVVRGAERYTHSTSCEISVVYHDNRRSYLSLDLTAEVKHHIGTSSVAFYDDDNLLGIVDISQSQSSVQFTANVDYGYHKLYAKFMGNAECLSSKSHISELTVNNPDLPDTEFVVDLYRDEVIDNYISPNVTLNSNNVALSNRQIKVYVDEVLESTRTLNGTTSLNIYSLSKGVHKIKFDFEGDEEYLASSYEFNVYVGYNILAELNRPSVVVGETVTIDVDVLSYKYGDGIIGEEITVVGFNTTGTTDDDGHASINVVVNSVVSSITIRHTRTNTTIVLPIQVVTISSIEMSASNDITFDGNDTLVSIIPRLANGASVPNLLVDVNGTDYTTDNTGLIEYTHTGNGGGLTRVTATSGGVSEYVEFEDVIRYWSTERTANWYYSKVKEITVTEMNQGLQLRTASNGTGQIYFGYSESKTQDWIFEFTVKSVTESNVGGQLLVCIHNLGRINANSRIRVQKIGNVQEFYVNDSLIVTNTNSSWFVPFLVVNGASVLIDKLKIMRL